MNFDLISKLPKPARYFPLDKGIYEVAPNLRNFGMDFGNGSQDKKVFQLDSTFPEYRKNKIQCRQERLTKYILTHNLSKKVEVGVHEFVVNRLVFDWPELFTLEKKDNVQILHCALTGESIVFDSSWNWIEVKGSEVVPPYISGLDALYCQFQEDAAVTSRDESEREGWLSALLVCSPSHWAPESKIGRNYSAVHAPIAGAEKMNRTAPQLVDGAIRKGPYVRFVWGFGTDARLNHHPEPTPGCDPAVWKGRSFQKESTESPFILRLERQLLYGLPHLDAYFFGIHVYFIDGKEIRANARERELLSSALLSMTPDSLQYKGLQDCLQDVLTWFGQGTN